MTRIKLTNESRYDTRALRAFLARVLKRYEKVRGGSFFSRRFLRGAGWVERNPIPSFMPKPVVNVIVRTAKQARGVTGLSYIGSARGVRLRLPVETTRLITGSDGVTRTELGEPEAWSGDLGFDVAWVFMHELDHAAGMRHEDMADTRLPYQRWAEPFKGTEIPIKAKTPKPERNVVSERAERARKMLARHEARLKRQENLVQKWRKKVRYYEGRG